MYTTEWDVWRIKGTFEPEDTAAPVVVDGKIVADVDRFAARVHAAGMAEKQRQGFADHPYDYRLHDGPRCCDQPHDCHHKDMVPFDQLSEATKDYDRATVRAVLTALIEEEAP